MENHLMKNRSHNGSSVFRTARTEVRRRPERASYERAELNQILDEALYCHVGFIHEGQPYVMPTIYARIDEQLYLHGAATSRMLRSMAEGTPVCVTVTILDGLVLARSAFHHSMNYRSVVILGTAVEVTDHSEKLAALRQIVEHIVSGRWQDVRQPNEKEINATKVLRIPIAEASAKIRTGPPVDDENDYDLPYWAGEIPMQLTPSAPVAETQMRSDIALPTYLIHVNNRVDKS